MTEGYQPDKGNLNTSDPPKGGSGVPSKGKKLFSQNDLVVLLQVCGTLETVANMAPFLDMKDYRDIKVMLDTAHERLEKLRLGLFMKEGKT